MWWFDLSWFVFYVFCLLDCFCYVSFRNFCSFSCFIHLVLFFSCMSPFKMSGNISPYDGPLPVFSIASLHVNVSSKRCFCDQTTWSLWSSKSPTAPVYRLLDHSSVILKQYDTLAMLFTQQQYGCHLNTTGIPQSKYYKYSFKQYGTCLCAYVSVVYVFPVIIIQFPCFPNEVCREDKSLVGELWGAFRGYFHNLYWVRQNNNAAV